MVNKPILCLDFDGVIHRYSKGWQKGEIYDPVVPGFFEWALKASASFKLVVYSSRSKDHEQGHEMVSWLWDRAEEFFEDAKPPNIMGSEEIMRLFTFAHEKPPAFLTIDDRAMQFRGDWSAWWLDPARLLKFKPWMQGKQECPEDWRVIEDDPPPTDGEEVLVAFKGQFQWIRFIVAAFGKETQRGGYAKPTHWTKLPDPPPFK